MSKLYKVVFRGEIESEKENEKLIQSLRNFFKINAENEDELFSGKTFTLKDDLPYKSAIDVVVKFLKVGVVTYVEGKNIATTNSESSLSQKNGEIDCPSTLAMPKKEVLSDSLMLASNELKETSAALAHKFNDFQNKAISAKAGALTQIKLSISKLHKKFSFTRLKRNSLVTAIIFLSLAASLVIFSEDKFVESNQVLAGSENLKVQEIDLADYQDLITSTVKELKPHEFAGWLLSNEFAKKYAKGELEELLITHYTRAALNYVLNRDENNFVEKFVLGELSQKEYSKHWGNFQDQLDDIIDYGIVDFFNDNQEGMAKYLASDVTPKYEKKRTKLDRKIARHENQINEVRKKIESIKERKSGLEQRLANAKHNKALISKPFKELAELKFHSLSNKNLTLEFTNNSDFHTDKLEGVIRFKQGEISLESYISSEPIPPRTKVILNAREGKARVKPANVSEEEIASTFKGLNLALPTFFKSTDLNKHNDKMSRDDPSSYDSFIQLAIDDLNAANQTIDEITRKMDVQKNLLKEYKESKNLYILLMGDFIDPEHKM